MATTTSGHIANSSCARRLERAGIPATVEGVDQGSLELVSFPIDTH